MEMIEKADTSPIARQTLVAYVAGVGEAAGAIVDTIGNGSRTVSCRKSFSLDTGSVSAALEAGAPRQDSWSPTPATPLIVADMVKRAGCKAKGLIRAGPWIAVKALQGPGSKPSAQAGGLFHLRRRVTVDRLTPERTWISGTDGPDASRSPRRP